MPGPLIEANWGDTVRVTVINQMQDNGTTIHFHGIRQNHTNQYDGVPSITQCPIPPGEQMTYVFTATSYGSSWYHSHFALQTWEGVYGPINIYGPSSAEYDVDAGHIFLQDWSHETVDTLYARSQSPVTEEGARAPAMDNGLINGMNTWGPDGSFNQTGKRFEMNVVKGKSYLLRLVSVGIQSSFKFYIDGHKLKVISTDFTPIVPYETDILDINIGQRYEVIVSADQAVGDYWMRSDNQDPCGNVRQGHDIRAIVHYNGGPGAMPTSTAYNYTPACVDEDPALHTPVLALDAADADAAFNADVSVTTDANNVYKWFIDGTTFVAHWGDPTLRGIVEKGVVNNYSGKLLLTAPTRNEWIYVIMQSTIDFPHPVHLHGHDFGIVGIGNGTYTGDTALRLQNPARRDTVMMPGGGYVVLAWRADNPGVWNMHCHVGFHQAMGFAAQIVELEAEIAETFDDDGSGLGELCGAWNEWAEGRGLEPQSGV
ncbi:multicopper oxidase [Aplosporella prunicola CBS 121167]|uniref:Multicopper oxidase n=1 Tax=Aplosporella prunicola CBS 121167 TaxID=1176127 RepID=A0A6A6AZK3_9PEZI|nr:multicopper oxidase [Aplosporella prunicola CBS 121167]KAF2135901.1 multicopper oxidase [Aplosporella prunicola CBS 121167]